MFKIGDRVQALDDNFEGVVRQINGHQITIETTDGFEMTYFVNEVVKINETSILESSIKSVNTSMVSRMKQDDAKPKNRVRERVRGVIPPPEYDLHIEKLVKNHQQLDQADILQIQTDTARIHIDHALRNRIPKIVLIHGVGEGVLKQELEVLFRRYDGLTHRDADYRKYGSGATEVYFKQNVK
jgi:dsDNA-specific endonuclease/ATPase MutS2